MTDIHEGVPLGGGGTSQEPVVDRALEHLADIVNHLIRRETAAATAVGSARERLEGDDHAALLRAIEVAHGVRVETLARLVYALGGEPADRGGLRSLLDRARVLLAARHGDPGILEALAEIEGEIADQYRGNLEVVGFSDEERAVLAAGLTDADAASAALVRSAALSLPH